MKFIYSLKTRYSETAQDRIIHHSAYVIYLETARVEFFNSINCSINELEKNDIFCPVVEASMNYLKPLFSSEEVTITMDVGHFSKVRFKLNYQLFRDELQVAYGTTTHCFVNKNFKPIAIPSKVIACFKTCDPFP